LKVLVLAQNKKIQSKSESDAPVVCYVNLLLTKKRTIVKQER